jgi:hypothetical protein
VTSSRTWLPMNGGPTSTSIDRRAESAFKAISSPDVRHGNPLEERHSGSTEASQGGHPPLA